MTEDKQKHYLIYQTTNLVNGKIYIGKHETYDVEDEYFGSGNYLRNAINKHGIENFEFKILIDLKNREEMNLLEKLVVTEEFCARSDTYNIKVGGDGGWDYVNNLSTYKRGTRKRALVCSKASKESKRMMKERGTSPTAIHLQKLSLHDQKRYRSNMAYQQKLWHANHPGYFAGERNPMYGHVDSEETRQKRIMNHLGSKNSQYGKMWICNDETRESRSISKTDPIPEGWRKGRICKK